MKISGRMFFACLSVLMAGVLETARAQDSSVERAGASGTVIRGGSENPEGVFSVPWRDPASVPPATLIQAEPPAVFDKDRSLVADSLNRAVPAHVRTAPAATPVAAPTVREPVRSRRRAQDRDDGPRPVIMESRP